MSISAIDKQLAHTYVELEKTPVNKFDPPTEARKKQVLHNQFSVMSPTVHTFANLIHKTFLNGAASLRAAQICVCKLIVEGVDIV